MKIIVLGAGLAGISSAWYLAAEGHEVTVLERQPGPGLETSFANGGQISASHPEPWANPGAPLQILRWLGREDAPLLLRLRADPPPWSWGLRFLRQCTPGMARRNTDAIAALGLYSRRQLVQLRTQLALDYDCETRGILHLFFSAAELRHVEERVSLLRRYDMRAESCDALRCLDIEPALADCRDRIHGGLYAPDDESGDAHQFVRQLAQHCMQRGVRLRTGTRVERLVADGDMLAGIDIIDADKRPLRLTADAYLVCLGAESPRLLAPLGERLPIYPVKGYSVTVPAGDGAPHVSITDESRRIVCSRLGKRLRIAGTAELAGYDLTLRPARCQAILERALELFPRGGDAGQAELWTGLRPATPSNVPIIGRSRWRKLYYNTGHGTLGWTLACGSARAITDIVGGRRPEVVFPFFGASS
ncbi:MAG: D-amino acid dehydrogenase [Betaproteobacteria bacterium]|nr:D-amino acid dehydrogenase [Betaproteobacteria bacterium]